MSWIFLAGSPRRPVLLCVVFPLACLAAGFLFLHDRFIDFDSFSRLAFDQPCGRLSLPLAFAGTESSELIAFPPSLVGSIALGIGVPLRRQFLRRRGAFSALPRGAFRIVLRGLATTPIVESSAQNTKLIFAGVPIDK